MFRQHLYVSWQGTLVRDIISCDSSGVACEYRLHITCIAGAMKVLANHINFRPVRANSARILLRSAMAPLQLSIGQKDYQYVQIMTKAIIDGSRCWIDNPLKSVPTQRQQLFAVDHGQLLFPLIADNHFTDIGSLYRQKWQRNAPSRTLRSSVNRLSWIVNVASFAMYVPIGCSHPVMIYWWSWLAKTTGSCSLPHPKDERQCSVNSCSSCLCGNQGTV